MTFWEVYFLGFVTPLAGWVLVAGVIIWRNWRRSAREAEEAWRATL